MGDLDKFLRGGIDSFRRAAAVNGIVNGSLNVDEGAGDEQLILDSQASVSVPTDDSRFVATSAPALGGINPLYIIAGAGLIAFVALRR